MAGSGPKSCTKCRSSAAPVGVHSSVCAAPAVTGNDLPATMSPALLQDKLRGELGFEGLVVTDALEMHAVSRRFSNAKAAVRAFLAGADILLCPQNLQEAFEGVLRAVEDGSIPRGRLESSVRRILALKRKIRPQA